MFFIESIARQFLPECNEDTSLSVVCICTTNPVYLVFNRNPKNPELVVRIADSEEVCRAHHVIEKLYQRLGGLVPEPIAVKQFNSHKFAVQKGVKGKPWFQLASRISTQSQWRALRKRAITALNQLHEGTAKVEGWNEDCCPGEELRISLKECVATGTNVSASLKRQVLYMSHQLDELGTLRTYRQHGDFCLNNLIVEEDSIHIIDFEDFGMTSMPLFDEISLALSMSSQAPKNIITSLSNEIKNCTAEGAESFGISKELFPAFFMHHLLLRLGNWSVGPQRQAYRKWLLNILDDFASGPTKIIS